MSSQHTAPSYLRYFDRIKMAVRACHEAVRRVFGSEPFALTSLMGPLSDGPAWPSDASWLALEHGDCSCIVSDGLSAPWVERNRPDTGLGLEVFVESPDVPFSPDDPMALSDTWQFPMTAGVSHTLAAYPHLCRKLLDGGVLSYRFNIEQIKNGHGLVGALLHVPESLSEGLVTDMGKVSLAAAILLTTEERRWLQGRRADGRNELRVLLNDAGGGSQSMPDRPSMITP